IPDQADTFLKYYHSFFKAIYSINIGDYTSAKEQYEEAETLLKNIPDELEIAEFNYMFGSFHYHIYQPLPAIKYTTKAKELFSKHEGYEIKVAACNNTLGLACTSLGQYESAEEHFLAALNTFNKHDEDKLSAKVKHNLGLLYADQNLSELAIKYLNGSLVNNQKTLFLLAQEYFKLNYKNAVTLHIEKGLKISNEEYNHHFNILKGLNDNISTDELEEIILAGICYFKK
ncbi:TPA: tetratricopeptide repeat protein, partial [Bacillus toyonensis]|nr:tetratricopeptide repeat protein [Bacillus toyonensis]